MAADVMLVGVLSPVGATEALLAAARAGADAVMVRLAGMGDRPARLPFELAEFDVGTDAPAASLTGADLATLVSAARAQGVDVVVSIVDEEGLTLARGAGAAAVHLPAAVLVDLALVAAVAPATPVWLDTAMTTADEVAEAVAEVLKAGGRPTLLHGVVTSPARPEELNLRALVTLATRFGVPVGLHARDAVPAIALAAVALGASILAVPFATDARGAFDVAALAALRAELSLVARALGDGDKRVQPSEWTERDRAQRSLVARVDIARGHIIRADMLTTARPGIGLKPRAAGAIVGRRAVVDIPVRTLITLGMLE